MGGQTIRRWRKPLYLMIKPRLLERAAMIRLCAALGIEISYAPERWHSTLLPLGESLPATIGNVHRALERLDADPFRVAFDHIEGDTLKPRKGQRAPGYFQRMLAARIARSGVPVPDYAFSLHLNLAYGGTSVRRAAVPPIEMAGRRDLADRKRQWPSCRSWPLAADRPARFVRILIA